MNPMRGYREMAVVFLALLLLAAGAGCGGDDNPENPTGKDSGMTVDEFEAATDAMVKSLNDVSGMFMLPGGGPLCVSVSSTVDSDADGIPDDAFFNFSGSGCRFEGDNFWGTTSGSIRVQDTGSGVNCLCTLADLAVGLGQIDPPRTVTRVSNGTRTIAGTTTAATMTQDVTTAYNVTGGFNATVVHHWSAAFTAAAGAPPILSGSGLPVGDATVQGVLEWNYGERSRQFVLSTVTPLHWPADCNSAFPSAGEIHAAITLGTVTGYVRIVYQGCWQDPEVDFVRL